MPKQEKDFIEMFQNSLEYDEQWRVKAQNDVHYYAGNQWSEADIDKLKKQGRPALVINRIKAQVDAVCGYQRQNRYDIKFLADKVKDAQAQAQNNTWVEDLNTEISDIMSDDGGLGHQSLSLMFESGLKTGRGFIEVYLDSQENLLDPRIVVEKLNCLHVLFDPCLTKYDINQGAYVIKSVMSSEQTLCMKFPEFEKDIKSMGVAARLDPHENDMGRERFDERHLAEIWHKEVIKEKILIDPILSKIIPLDGKKSEREEIIHQYILSNIEIYRQTFQQGLIDEAFIAKVARQIVIKDRNSWEIRSAILINQNLMRDEVPYKKVRSFPIIGFFPYWNEEALDNHDRYQGIIRQLRDLNLELNKRRSVGLHILGTQANSGIIADEASMSSAEIKKLSDFGSKPGLVSTYDSRKGQPPQRWGALPPSSGHLAYEEKAADDMPMVSGVNPERFVATDNRESGRALALKIQQSQVMIQGVFDNFMRSTRLCGEVIVQMIEEKNDIDLPNRKIVVAESPHNPTLQLLRQQELSEFVEKYSALIPPQILAPIVIEESNLNEGVKEKLLQGLQQGMQEAAIQAAQAQNGQMPPK